MNLEIGGSPAGTLYGKLTVTGVATLAGKLKVSAINNFTPTIGDTFQLVSFASESGSLALETNLSGILITASTNLSVAITSGNFVKLLLLVPGETAAPGTPTGKTGIPLATLKGIPFNVTVNAVDESWSIIHTASDTVGITSSDSTATLPPNAALVNGTVQMPATLNTNGVWSVTASDITSPVRTSSAVMISAQDSVPRLVAPAESGIVDTTPFPFEVSAVSANPADVIKFKVEILQNGAVVQTFDQTADVSPWDMPSYTSGQTATLNARLKLVSGTYQWQAQVYYGSTPGLVSTLQSFQLLGSTLTPGVPFTQTFVANDSIYYSLTLPQAGNFWLTLQDIESTFTCSVTVLSGTTVLASASGGTDLLLQAINPAATQLTIRIDAASAGNAIIKVMTDLPAISLGVPIIGKTYHNNGLDWLQMDVLSQRGQVEPNRRNFRNVFNN